MFITIVGLIIVGFFLYGFQRDGILEDLEHKKLKDLTFNDIASIALGIVVIFLFIKLLRDLF